MDALFESFAFVEEDLQLYNLVDDSTQLSLLTEQIIIPQERSCNGYLQDDKNKAIHVLKVTDVPNGWKRCVICFKACGTMAEIDWVHLCYNKYTCELKYYIQQLESMEFMLRDLDESEKKGTKRERCYYDDHLKRLLAMPEFQPAASIFKRWFLRDVINKGICYTDPDWKRWSTPLHMIEWLEWVEKNKYGYYNELRNMVRKKFKEEVIDNPSVAEEDRELAQKELSSSRSSEGVWNRLKQIIPALEIDYNTPVIPLSNNHFAYQYKVSPFHSRRSRRNTKRACWRNDITLQK